MRELGAVAFVIVALLTAATAWGADGRQLYLRQCAPCHGVTGRGDGTDAALFAMRPRDLQDGVLNRYPTDELVHRVREGKPLTLAADPAALRRRATTVEAMVAYLQRLPTVNWRQADAGWEIYVDRCAGCHGPYGTPLSPPAEGVRPPRSLADPAFQSSVSDETMVEVVRHGREGMPGLVPRLSAAEARQVAAYVRLFSPGFETYTSTCAACHGDHGVPNSDLAAGVPAPTVIFNQQYFAGHDPDVLRGTIWHMLDQHEPVMPHYAGALTDAEARAIVMYLKRAGGAPGVER